MQCFMLLVFFSKKKLYIERHYEMEMIFNEKFKRKPDEYQANSFREVGMHEKLFVDDAKSDLICSLMVIGADF